MKKLLILALAVITAVFTLSVIANAAEYFNVAKGKTVTATFPSADDPYDMDNLIDGDYASEACTGNMKDPLTLTKEDTAFRDQFASDNGGEDVLDVPGSYKIYGHTVDTYYEIDLGGVYALSAYRMYFYRHPTYGLPETWVIFVSENGTDWTRIGSYQKTVRDTLPELSFELYEFENVVNARYFRLAATRTQAIFNSTSGIYWDRACINEIEVLSESQETVKAEAATTAAPAATTAAPAATTAAPAATTAAPAATTAAPAATTAAPAATTAAPATTTAATTAPVQAAQTGDMGVVIAAVLLLTSVATAIVVKKSMN